MGEPGQSEGWVLKGILDVKEIINLPFPSQNLSESKITILTCRMFEFLRESRCVQVQVGASGSCCPWGRTEGEPSALSAGNRGS